MRDFDHSNPTDRKVRAYRTRAAVAALHAQNTGNPACAGAWAYIAESLTHLADMLERDARYPPPQWPKS